MKKLLLLFLSLLLVFSLAACTGSSNGEDASVQSSGNNSTTDSKYVFQVANSGNFTVKIDQNMADVIQAIGEPLSYFEAASCAFDGLDKTYTYAGFIITTRPDGEQDFVNSIRLTDDSVTTPEGAYVGMKTEDILSAYGAVTEQTDTLLRYDSANTSLNFTLENGVVVSIEYIPA